MSELLSSSKRKYIENWRQSVCQHMESGTICKVTISEMTPEPAGYIGGYIKPSNEHVKAMASRSPPPASENTSPSHLPAVKFGYSHGTEDAKKHNKHRNVRHYEISRTVLPPSPNGMLIQNGGSEKPTSHDRKLSTLRAIENNVNIDTERQDVADSKDTKEHATRSAQLAREIYNKYNMKSRVQTTLPGKHMYSGMDQFTMPWRNKTFLTLPVRFNESAKRKQMKYLARERTSLSSRKDDLSSSLLTNESRYNFRDLEGDIP